MLIPGTTLQVPYLADLVTLADPASSFSYLNYLRKQNRLLQFGMRQAQHITRTEYNRYCRWVCGQLDNLLFNYHVESIGYEPSASCYHIHCKDEKGDFVAFRSKKIVIGTGSIPALPACIKSDQLSCDLFHSSDYLYHQNETHDAQDITIVGSGQSAAEIYFDLLCKYPSKQLNWFTRSDRLYAMEDHKFIYEMNTPDYINYFYKLDAKEKKKLFPIQHSLYKGVNKDLLNAIYDQLYEQRTESGNVSSTITADLTLEHVEKIKGHYELSLRHNRKDQVMMHKTNCVILATGYRHHLPEFISGIHERIAWLTEGLYNVNSDYSIDEDHSIYIQNAEMHTHGFNAADLSLGPYRNAVIINAILGRDHYPIDRHTTFQQFGVPID
jgi:lysine N6-hydroxylase